MQQLELNLTRRLELKYNISLWNLVKFKRAIKCHKIEILTSRSTSTLVLLLCYDRMIPNMSLDD